MDKQYLKITSIGHITPDVLQINTEKPSGIDFTPGQAADISINKEGWLDEIRPFTFTCIPPFISILRYVSSKKAIGDNTLIFANKSKADIILKQEFKQLLGKNFINILSGEQSEGYSHGYITEEFLKGNIRDFSKYFYVCGPPPMMDVCEKILPVMGIPESRIIKEGM